MRKKLTTLLLAMSVAFSAVGPATPSNTKITATAATRLLLEDKGSTCTSGKYIYYAYEMGGVRSDISRYDTSNNTTKSIVSYKKNGFETNGFYDINVKGNYIIATWDMICGTESSLNYIYRFTKDGKKQQKLTAGIHPMVIGNYIYYQKCKVTSQDLEYKHTIPTKYIYRMKLDGTKKEKVAKLKNPYVKLYTKGNNIYYSLTSYNSKMEEVTTYYGLDGTSYKSSQVGFTASITAGEKNAIERDGYLYYIDTLDKEYHSFYTKLKRKNIKTGTVETLITLDHYIEEARFCGKRIFVRGIKYDGKDSEGYSCYKNYVYAMKLSGEAKKCLMKWTPGE